MDIFSAAVLLFLVMDPLGNIPFFLSVLKHVEPRRRRRVLIRELALSLIVLLFFLFAGGRLLELLDLREESIRIAGGIILFLIALRMIFPQKGGLTLAEAPAGEPFLVPLAVPFVAGPSTMATLLLLSRSEPGRTVDWLAALLVAWGATAVILLCSGGFHRILKQRGLIAIERLMGMLLVAVSVQMLLDGLAGYLGLEGRVGR